MLPRSQVGRGGANSLSRRHRPGCLYAAPRSSKWMSPLNIFRKLAPIVVVSSHWMMFLRLLSSYNIFCHVFPRLSLTSIMKSMNRRHSVCNLQIKVTDQVQLSCMSSLVSSLSKHNSVSEQISSTVTGSLLTLNSKELNLLLIGETLKFELLSY